MPNPRNHDNQAISEFVSGRGTYRMVLELVWLQT
jgi:hypothetical protein